VSITLSTLSIARTCSPTSTRWIGGAMYRRRFGSCALGGGSLWTTLNLASDEGWAAFLEDAKRAQELERLPYLPAFQLRRNS
jgi:hypothetical protein